jgi:hypothetical protein
LDGVVVPVVGRVVVGGALVVVVDGTVVVVVDGTVVVVVDGTVVVVVVLDVVVLDVVVSCCSYAVNTAGVETSPVWAAVCVAFDDPLPLAVLPLPGRLTTL